MKTIVPPALSCFPSTACCLVGMVCTGKDADATLFPLNTLVLLTDVLAASGKAGKKKRDTGED
ncbi:hypothetical protein [Serratia fonticola]|uniref:hypothetical protein n=1 Tax=Serratia fonticola TaxID=47917 RepID=UPI0021BD0E8F|nr:hypothetical protein [Serratia fonticola]